MRPVEGFRIKVTADENCSFTLMFEPSGMTYDLGPAEAIFATLEGAVAEDLEIVYWQGGISVWPPGHVMISDAEGNELHRLP